MRLLLAMLGLVATATGQNESGGSLNPVRYDANGWPIVAGEAPAPAGETKAARQDQPQAQPATPVTTTSSDSSKPMASGMQLDSPLHDVFRAVRSPGALRELGGRRIFWRLRIHGTNGETIGIREVTHTVDCRFPDRDRIEHQDGRVYGRIGKQVFAQRGGIPWPTLKDTAAAELALFAMHVREPWCFGDAASYAVKQVDVVQRQGQPLKRIVIERRPPASERVFGPEANPKPRDRFEVLFESTTGLPRELVHRFANSKETRRVLLEDWADVGGVRMPKRRIYVDETLRPTTTIELLDMQPQRVSERDFRLH